MVTTFTPLDPQCVLVPDFCILSQVRASNDQRSGHTHAIMVELLPQH